MGCAELTFRPQIFGISTHRHTNKSGSYGGLLHLRKKQQHQTAFSDSSRLVPVVMVRKLLLTSNAWT
jgi:hypothetical protein